MFNLFNNLFQKKSRYSAQSFEAPRVEIETGQFRITPLTHEVCTELPLTGRYYQIEQKQNGEWVKLRGVQEFSFYVNAHDPAEVALTVTDLAP